MASALVLSGVLCAGIIATGVQLLDAATPVTEEYAAAIWEPQAQTRIISEFSELAGSDANARSLVAGLRQGSEITLTVPANGGRPGTATRFTPPTRPMDYGNVHISLALAREQLAQLGVTRPTPSHIKAVLAGGGVASRVSGRPTPFLLPGVLQMRAGGMGWAKIAGTMGVTLGQAMNGKAHRAAFTTPPVSPHTAEASAMAGAMKVAVSGAGTPARPGEDKTPPLVTSASITKTAAASASSAAVVRQPARARRPARGGPEPEIRRSRASIMAAADSAAKTGNVRLPVQERANSTDVIPGAAVEAPGAVDEVIRHEEGQTAD